MTGEQLRTVLDYHCWALGRLLAALDPLTPEQPNALLSPDPFPDLTTIRRIWSGSVSGRRSPWI